MQFKARSYKCWYCHMEELGKMWIEAGSTARFDVSQHSISLSGLQIHTLCNSEQVSIDGFLFWHRGCSSPTQLCPQSWLKKFPPWIPHSSLLVLSSALQFLVPSVGRQIYKPHCKPITAAILPTDSVYSKGLPTAAVWLMAMLQESSSPIELLVSKRHSPLRPYYVHTLDPL